MANLDKRSKAYKDSPEGKAEAKASLERATRASAPAVPPEPKATVTRSESQREEAAPVRRKERISLGAVRPNFEIFGDIPGYHLHGFVDLDGRLELALLGGYEFVRPGEVKVGARVVADKDADGRISWHSGTREDGSSYRTYLMKIEQEYWEENQQDIQDQNDNYESQIRAGNVGDVESRYIPQRTGGISIKQS